MFRMINLALIVAVLVAGFKIYTLEFRTRAKEREIVRIEKEIAQEKENIRLLDAEWSYLSSPKRIERLAREYLKLEPVKADQFVELSNLGARLPELPPVDPAATNEDPIGAILKELQ
jgi:cell division protein FtsL